MDAIALATRQRADFSLLGRPLEIEPRDVGARGDLPFPELDLVARVRDFLPYGLVRVECVPALIDIANLNGFANLERSSIWLFHTRDHAEQRRLARAVRADHADDAAARKGEAQVIHQEVVAVALLQTPCLDHDVAQPRPGCDV